MAKKIDIPWVIQDQTIIKHQLLEKYIGPWMNILYQQQARMKIKQHLMYVDGFSGPGYYWSNEQRNTTCIGSPLMVASKANFYIGQNPNRKFDILCIDKEAQCVNLLAAKLAEQNIYKQDWKVVQAQFESEINSLLNNIESSRTKLPIFFFIDPFGYSDFSMNTIKRILQQPLVELFINFMVYDIVRHCENAQFYKNMEQLFGNTKFKEFNYGSPEQKQAYLINLYCENLRSIGGAKYVMPFRVNTPNMGTRPRFYLVHASNNYKALTLMKDNMSKVSESPYGFEAIGIASGQMSLFEDPQKLELIKRILEFCEKRSQRPFEYDKIEEWAYVNTNGVSRTIKEALLVLEKENVINIERLPKQRKNTVTSGALINITGIALEHLF
ncbi:three-Cys-motif partner protein TcmP [Desulfosporosinus sp. BG]|uniref:three-Cys-motif partner protein TcmP n=1 Tax=Desulfosporosinus sp. BG TaxID=1633135 RepID=UPI000856FCA5|nr:three-Cys-motif partner protein TcmP [Desulfosporosinus sp. BG]ODA40137.1 hypothetical protein DSBG_3082 [Desulfosporosinus sp. BG]